MSKFLSAFFLMTGLAFVLPQAQSEPDTPKKTVKKKTTKKKPAEKKDEESSEKVDEKVDTTGHASTQYSCEFGDKITILTKSKDDQEIVVRWRNRLHHLLRVKTTTGADRFEGEKSGLVWVGIPSKGMLLDAHKGRPLANECKDNAQSSKSST